MRVKLTKRAKRTYHTIRNYLLEEWGEQVVKAFEIKTMDFFDLLEAFPEIGTLEYPDKEILGFQLTKQTRVFYRVKGNQIIILAFFDTRQNPRMKPK